MLRLFWLHPTKRNTDLWLKKPPRKLPIGGGIIAAVMLFNWLNISCTNIHPLLVQDVQVQLYVAGNEPFTRLMAVFPNGQTIEISPQSPAYHRLWQLQGQSIRILKGQLLTNNHHQQVLIQQFKTSHSERKPP